MGVQYLITCYIDRFDNNEPGAPFYNASMLQWNSALPNAPDSLTAQTLHGFPDHSPTLVNRQVKDRVSQNILLVVLP